MLRCYSEDFFSALIIAPVGLGACRMGVSNHMEAEARGVLEGGVSHTFFLLSYSTKPIGLVDVKHNAVLHC